MESVVLPSDCKVISQNRISVKGKFLYCGSEKFYVKGVTYGTFKPREEGYQFPVQEVIAQDFSMMAAQGINCVRTYTVPPKHLLDIALHYGLKVMVGLPWEQHITFLDESDRTKDIIKRVGEGVAACGQHPAILCFTIGNEIPAGIVRWYGKEKIEKFLKQLYKAVKAIDPACLVTYVNYPTTEYLDLDFLDFYCFNVYLETPEKLSTYIARLHNLAKERPLVLAEIGLDSLRKGEDQQAETLAWQIDTIFAKGCAGMFVFAWTDEWWRGGFDIEDWDFGIVDRQRNPKPALSAVREAMGNAPFSGKTEMPFFSVVVCTYNGAATIRDTMEGLMKLDYPNFEVIVVDDGSRDHTALIVESYPVKLINTANKGLSNARNTGLYAAKGDIIAYIDDDAYPDPHWLQYLAAAYLSSPHAGMGGPNLVPEEDGPIARCVANAPGGPLHVLLSDEIAEHIPGCNMSFRREVLLEIGGFDPVYRSAGDDVDVCWRVQEAGRTIGFHPSAVVWHHRRNSFKAYWKQQQGYGKAEALLEEKWPGKYNAFGHLTWAGRIYGNGFTLPIQLKKAKIFHGTWGTALFQSVYQPAEGFISALPLMPEWYLITGLLAFVASLGFFWSPLLWAWAFFATAVAITVIQAAISSYRNVSLSPLHHHKIRYKLLITFLHIVQPMARLYGRLKHGLTPWRTRGANFDTRFLFALYPQIFTHWSEEWRANEDWLVTIERNLIGLKARVRRGGDFDNWDIQAMTGMFTNTRALLAIEEHGGAKQYLRLKCTTTFSNSSLLMLVLLTELTAVAFLESQWTVTAALGGILFLLLSKLAMEAACCRNSMYTAFAQLSEKETEVAPAVSITEEHLTILAESGLVDPLNISKQNGSLSRGKLQLIKNLIDSPIPKSVHGKA